MRPHAHDGRGARDRGRRARAPRRAIVVAGGLTVALAATSVAQQRPSGRPVVVREAAGDAVAGGLDLTRAQLGRSGDGRLRAVLTLAEEFSALDLLARSGPPGSLCARLWTQDRVRPTDAPPTHLVCVTGQRGGASFRGSVLQLVAGSEPRRVASATVTRPSNRSIALRFSVRVIGRPRLVRWQAEAVKPGCPRLSCVDVLPDAPKHATLRLAD